MQTFVFKREIVGRLSARLAEPRRFIQVVNGPRQAGKTTAVNQVLSEWSGPSHYATADLPAPPQPGWIEHQWQNARTIANEGRSAVLVLDEVQKVTGWAEMVKRCWDEDSRQS